MRPKLFALVPIAAALVVAAPAAAKTVPGSPPFRVLVMKGIPNWMFARFAREGAVGLLRAEIGPTTNRRQSLAELERGTEVNARLGGVPKGPRLLAASSATGIPTVTNVVIVELPPAGRPVPNDRLYRIAAIGRGLHGLLSSPTTRILGLVSIVDIAPTALGLPYTRLSSIPAGRPLDYLARLGAQIHAEDRLKYASLLVLTGALMLLALLRWRAAMTAIPAALLTSLALGATHVSNEVAIVALFTAGTALGALLLARLCRDDLAVLGLIVGVVALYAVVYARRPEWAAVAPLGPDQNQRFWGIGDQIGTLLLAPLLAAALIARQRFGTIGFAAVSAFGLLVMTDNRLGANGGGAMGLGLGLAVLGSRLLRRGLFSLLALLAASAAGVLAIVLHGLATPGPNHLRSAFSGGLRGMLDVASNRVPLAYLPAFHSWPLVLPLALCLAGALAYAFHETRSRAGTSLLLGLTAAVAASLVVNDATGFMLAGGIAATAALTRFTPQPRTLVARASAHGLAPQPAGGRARD